MRTIIVKMENGQNSHIVRMNKNGKVSYNQLVNGNEFYARWTSVAAIGEGYQNEVSDAVAELREKYGKKCSCCRDGENNVPADHFVQGRVWNNESGRMMPFRKYVCNDHLVMMTMDDAEFSMERDLHG